MAMTGGKSYLLKSEVTNYGNGNDTTYLYLYVKETVSATANTSTLYLGMYISSTYNIGIWNDNRGSYVGLSTAEGSNRHDFDGTISKGSGTRWLVENVKFTVAHNSDGTKTVPIYWKWGVNSPWGQFVVPTGSKNITLTKIDRTAPTVDLVLTNTTTNGFKITATSNVTCNSWDYSCTTDGTVKWTNFSTNSGTSASVTLNNLKTNTGYYVSVRARKSANNVYGTSRTAYNATLGRSVLSIVEDSYIDTATVNIKIDVLAYSGDFTHQLSVRTSTTASSTELFKISSLKFKEGLSNNTITLTAAQKDLLLKETKNTSEKFLYLYLLTYNGSTLLGESFNTWKVKTSNENSCPAWESPYISWEDTSDCVELTGDSKMLIQGQSTLVVNALGVTARNYATLKSYSVTIGDKTVTSNTATVNVGKVDTSGKLSMRLTVTDSRGHSAYVTRNVTVLPYEKPKITRCVARRANGVGDVIQLSFSGTMSAIKPDGENDVNGFVNVSYRYKETSKPENFNDDGTGYSETFPIHDRVERSSTGTSFSFQTNQLVSLDPDYSFDLRIVVKDKLGSYVGYYVIPRGIPNVAVRKGKLGVNKPDPRYTMDVGGDIGFEGGVYDKNGRNVVGDTGWIDLGLSDSVSETSSANAGHYKGCAYRVVGENHVYVAFNVYATFSGSAVTVSGSAIPTAFRPKMQPYAIVSLNGSRVARILVSRTTGHAVIDWIRNVSDEAEPAEHIATWIDGYIDYWID